MAVARACELLGVPATATREDVERAYRARALQCHPDKVAHLDEEFRALAERKFREVRTAYEVLAGESSGGPRDAPVE
jgi:DnaJ like chaperone protein